MFKGFFWNLPNALTLFRLASVVLCVLPLLPLAGGPSTFRLSLSLVFFILGAVSDYFDGYFARSLNQTSEWGSYMDPLIDKIFIWGMYGAFLLIPVLRIPWWAVALIIFRDVLVTKMRQAALRLGIPFKTSFLAKSKTAVQMIVGIFILCYLWVTYSVVEFHNLGSPERMWTSSIKKVPSFLVIGAALFTLLTLFDYLFVFFKHKKNSSLQ